MEVVGRVDSGRVKISTEGDVLQIYLRETDADHTRPPFELREELSDFCQLKDASSIALMHMVISESSVDNIDEIFKRRGLQTDAPELEELARSAKWGQDPAFWAVRDSIIAKEQKRQYRGKTPNRHRARFKAKDVPSLDAVQQFISKVNETTSWSTIASQNWKDADSRALLSRMCRLERLDPHYLLPERQPGPWHKKIKDAGAYPDDAVGVFFREDPQVTKSSRYMRPLQSYPATVMVTKTEGIQVNVSHDFAVSIVEEDVVLAGEIYVGLPMGLHSQH